MENYKPLTRSTENLLSVFLEKAEQEKAAPKIQVNKVVSKLAFLYEKIRNVVEYKEEHLLRKNAIKRILKRRLTWKSNAKSIAAPLIYELIRGRYLENNAVPENKIKEVTNLINKYILLLNLVYAQKKHQEKEKRKLLDWVLGIAACEIEEVFVPHYKDEALVEYMYQAMTESIAWAGKMPEEERNIQIYIATHRTLVKSDREIIAYRVFNLYYPDWYSCEERLISDVAANIDTLYNAIENQIDHPLGSQLVRLVKKYIPPFIILRDVIQKDPEMAREVLTNSSLLEEKVREACDNEYKVTRTKLRRSSVRSIIYIFLTKMLLALVIEVPYDLYVAEKVNYLPLGINIIFHPFFLFLIALSIRVPAEENTSNITQSIKGIIYQGEKRTILGKIKTSVTRHTFFNILFNFIYLITFLVSFGILIYILDRLNFNVVSGGFFLLFLTLVSFFGIRNRETARELIVVDGKEGVLTTIVDFFSIPILRVGRWISLNFSRVNIFVFIFDFIIEAPFKAFIEIVEDFFAFIREKKEEITMK
jgi:hypothetical protein